MNNINKDHFDKDVKQYLNVIIPTCTPEYKERYFNQIIYPYLVSLAYNATYSFQFDLCGTFLYDDVAQQLIIHIFQKEDYILKHKDKNKFYNLYFTMMKRKFIDILRSKKAEDNRIANFIDMYFSAIAHMYSEARTGQAIIDYDDDIEYDGRTNTNDD